MTTPQLQSIQIIGYKAFKDSQASLGSLNVLVGANGSGKTSLFEFLKFIKNGLREIPPEIVPGTVGQKIFHGHEEFDWYLEFSGFKGNTIHYEGRLIGPIGKPLIFRESLEVSHPNRDDRNSLLSVYEGEGEVLQELSYDPDGYPNQPPIILDSTENRYQDLKVNPRRQLALGTITSPDFHTLFKMNEYIERWCFLDSHFIDDKQIRRPAVIQQNPVLNVNAGNLSALLHHLMTEDQAAFQELQELMRMVIPGFSALTVKARGGPGEVMAFWKEKGDERDIDLSLADLSAGSVRFLCWAALLVQSNPPPLICIDEPDLGLHPRTLALLAGLFEKASAKTQIILTTHSSYFLSQFDVSRVAITKKENGEAKFIRPSDSKALMANLEEFGEEELEMMHRSDELEALS